MNNYKYITNFIKIIIILIIYCCQFNIKKNLIRNNIVTEKANNVNDKKPEEKREINLNKCSLLKFKKPLFLISTFIFLTHIVVSNINSSNLFITNKKIIKCVPSNKNYNFEKKPEDIIFIHIPKTAGWAVSETLKAQANISVGHFANMDFSNGKKYLCKSRFHRPPSKKLLNSFTIVRNPYNRSISAYTYNKDIRGRKIKNYVRCTCEDFKLFTINAISMSNKNPSKHDCHYLTQWLSAKQAEYIVKFEELDKVYDIWRKFNISAKLIKNNISSQKCNKTNFFECIDKELGTIINEKYKEDFINLNYTMINFTN